MPTLDSNNTTNSSSYSQCAYNMLSTLVTIAAPAVLAYFTAPYLALAVRAIFPSAYAMVIGPPSTIGYYTQYIPAREYTCNLVYNNAHVIVGASSAVAQATAKTVSTITNSCASFFSSSKPKTPKQEPRFEQSEFEDKSLILNPMA